LAKPVGKSLLSDYKVLVLAVDEKYVSKTFQKQIASKDNELNLEDATKITGAGMGLRNDSRSRRRMLIFKAMCRQCGVQSRSRSIKDSKKFVEQFGQIVAAYKADRPRATDYPVRRTISAIQTPWDPRLGRNQEDFPPSK
jgi:predicted helicase